MKSTCIQCGKEFEFKYPKKKMKRLCSRHIDRYNEYHRKYNAMWRKAVGGYTLKAQSATPEAVI